jgi:hypothetical protein
MRAFPASVIGALTIGDCATLHRAAPVQLAGTVLMPAAAAAPAPAAAAAADSAALVALMRKLPVTGNKAITLRLPAPADVLATAAAAWAALAADIRPPLSDFYASLPDLTRRLAALMHLAATAGDDGSPGHEIPVATAKRAVAIVETCVAPVARAVLGPVSADEDMRDARRIIAYLRDNTSPQQRVFERRVLLRAWQRSITVPRLDRALDLLQQEGLIVARDKTDDGKGGGGKRFEVAQAVLAAV